MKMNVVLYWKYSSRYAEEYKTFEDAMRRAGDLLVDYLVEAVIDVSGEEYKSSAIYQWLRDHPEEDEREDANDEIKFYTWNGKLWMII